MTQLFHFTEAEEKAIRRAIAKAKKYMETYGKPPVISMINIKEINDDNSTIND